MQPSHLRLFLVTGCAVAIGACNGAELDGFVHIEPTEMTDSDEDTASVPTQTTPTDPGLAPFSASFLWQDIPFDDAVDHGHVPMPVPEAERVEAEELVLTEVAVDAGLSMAEVGGNVHGVGLGFFDLDGDGWEDIFVANGRGGGTNYDSTLWRNDGMGGFTDVSAATGIATLLDDIDTFSVAAADYDADGDVDLYVSAHPHSFLLRNDDGVFTDQTAAAGAGGPESGADVSYGSKIAAFGDYDGDGWLDIAGASSTFRTATRGGYLLRNQGDGTYADVSEATELQVRRSGNPCALMWTDYDNDGHQDLNIWNDLGRSDRNRTLLRNVDGSTFTDVTQAVGFTNSMGNPMGIGAGDVNRDGHLDYYVGNIGNSALLLSQGDGTFVDFALAAGVNGGGSSWGVAFEDLNADGWWDLFVAHEGSPHRTYTHNQDLPPTFTTHRWTQPDRSGHNVPAAFADYDHDGDVDVITGNTSGNRLQLYRNDTARGTNRFLEVQILDAPGTGEGTGVTARVVVKAGDDVWFKDVLGGSSRASQNALTTRFGLGHYTGADFVAVLFPDGRTMAALNVEGNTRLVLQ